MRVIYDFTARNGQELSVMKGDVVQVRPIAEKSYICDTFTRQSSVHLSNSITQIRSFLKTRVQYASFTTKAHPLLLLPLLTHE